MTRGFDDQGFALFLALVWPPVCGLAAVVAAVCVTRKVLGHCRGAAAEAKHWYDETYALWHQVCGLATEPTAQLPRVRADQGPPVTVDDQLVRSYRAGRGRPLSEVAAAVGSDRPQAAPQRRFSGELPTQDQRRGD